MLINLTVCCLSALALLAVDTEGLKTRNTKWHSTILLSNPDCIYDSWYRTHQHTCFRTGISDASHCLCLTLPTGIIWKKPLPPYLFVQPIAAHDFTIYLFDTHTSSYVTFEESWCVKHCSLWYTAQRVGDSKWAATQWVTVDSNWRTWLLAGAARAWAGSWQYAKFSPHRITERKRRTASYSWSVLLSYKLICMWAFSSPLIKYKAL